MVLRIIPGTSVKLCTWLRESRSPKSSIMMSQADQIFGGSANFWLWGKDTGFDLTHPPTPDSPLVYPRLPLETTKERATVDPSKTALVVVDFQNYFLSPALGRPAPSPSLEAVEKLVKTAIPACRTANIPVVWLGWGLEDKDLVDLPPTIVRGFGLDTNFEEPKSFGGLGEEIGQVELSDGTTVDGGRILMRDQWNTKFHPSLEAASAPHDMQISKNRLSGFWGGTDIEDTLKSKGIKTLLFAGGNLDQCVASSMQDAYQKGWDVLLLSDASVTNSPEFATKMVYFNCEGGWGFVLTCDQLAEGVGKMETSVNAE